MTAGAQQRVEEPARAVTRRADTLKPEILGTHGIVAAGRHYSVSAGVRILQQGGNAVDAGVASVLAASVCEISHFGFGGEAPTMIYDAKTGELIVINGQGPAPKAATPATFAANGLVPGNGPLGATIPAMLDAMSLALTAKGTMHLDQVMQPAIELADGFPMYEFLRNYLISERKATEQWEWSKKTYYPEGRVPEVGELFHQPNLARTLRAIAAADKAAFAKTHNRAAAIRAGRDTFYTGDIARRIADADKAAGGLFTYDDLASFHGAIEKPVTTSFHGYDIYKAGPWNQGPVLLQTLNILEGADLDTPAQFRRIHPHGHEAIKLAYADRNALLRRPGVRDGADRRPAVEGLRRRAARADWPAGVARTARRRSVRVRSVVKPPASAYMPHSQGRRAGAAPGTRRASTLSTRTATCSARRRAPGGCSAARSSPAIPASPCRTA